MPTGPGGESLPAGGGGLAPEPRHQARTQRRPVVVGGRADDPLQDWRHIWPPAVVKAVCNAVMTGPAEAYDLQVYRDQLTEIEADAARVGRVALDAGVPLTLLRPADGTRLEAAGRWRVTTDRGDALRARFESLVRSLFH